MKKMTVEEAVDYFENSNDGEGPDVDGWFTQDDFGAIQVARDNLEAAQVAMIDAVAFARDRGFPWSGVGLVLGITRQAAHSRYAKAVAERQQLAG